MPRYRIPNEKFKAEDKRSYYPEGEKEVHMLHAADCIFIDTEYLPGYGPTPEPVEEPVEEEPVEEDEDVVDEPNETWTKAQLIDHAKENDIYDPAMENRSYTKATILEVINSL